MYESDKRIVITLDAGGTNFVFSAIRGNEFVVDPITMPSNAHDLDLCLSTMVGGFSQIIGCLSERPVAISFAFPGPADYPNGIIGGFLPNFPSFRHGVALGEFLKRKFGVPVFINNDGDLFAYGEALAGALPQINAKLKAKGCEKVFKNLLGYTFGTGFGIGCVIDGRLNLGNNSCIETFCLPHKLHKGVIVEEGVSIRAIKRVYAELSGDNADLQPKEICEIADGAREGDQEAAREAFRRFGETAGDAIAVAVSLTDSIVVIGGGITGAKRHFMPALLSELRDDLRTLADECVNRVQPAVFDLDDEDEFDRFAKGDARKIKVYGYDDFVTYDPMKRTGIAISSLGASKAISIGAYCYALASIDGKQ